MQGGKIRHLITIEHKVFAEENALGERTPEWDTLATAWASITPLSARESFVADLTQAKVTHLISIRYLSTVTADCRITYNDRTFDIQSVINVGELNKETQIRAIEVAKTQ